MTHEVIRGEGNVEGYAVDDAPLAVESPEGVRDEDVVDVWAQLPDADTITPEPLPDEDVTVGEAAAAWWSFADGDDLEVDDAGA